MKARLCLKSECEFWVRETRYANYRYAIVDDIAIRFLSNLAQKASPFIPNSRKSWMQMHAR